MINDDLSKRDKESDQTVSQSSRDLNPWPVTLGYLCSEKHGRYTEKIPILVFVTFSVLTKCPGGCELRWRLKT